MGTTKKSLFCRITDHERIHTQQKWEMADQL